MTKNYNQILVYGATGKQGRVATRQLIDAGYAVRATTRDLESEHARELSDYGAEMVYASYDDPDSIVAALQGVDGLYLIIPSPLGYDDVNFAKRVIEPANEAGVKHIVYLSYLSADPDVGYEKAPKQATESYIREEQNIPYTIVRSVDFMEDFNEFWQDEIVANGFADPRDDDFPRQFIACKDLAGFAVRAFQDPGQWIGQAINVAAEEMTNVELAEIFNRVMGRDLPLRNISWDEWQEDYGIPPSIVEVWKWYNETRLTVDVDALSKDYPGMQMLEDFLRETGWEDFS